MVGACPIFDFPKLILYIQKLMSENEGFYENNAMTYLHKKCGYAQNKYGWSLPNIRFPKTNCVYSKVDARK